MEQTAANTPVVKDIELNPAEAMAHSSTILDLEEDTPAQTVKQTHAVSSIEPGDAKVNKTVFDPDKSVRQYHRHTHTGLQREIWRPGDGDGDQVTDFFDRKGPPLPLEKRWRLFQSDIGPIVSDKNIPPKFVFLDDKAVFEVLGSNLPRTRLPKWWPHDFGQACNVRNKRAHLGRAAIKNEIAEGDAKYESVILGAKGNPKYYFCGEKDYESIVYLNKPPEFAKEDVPLKRKADEAEEEEGEEEHNPRAHGHNQWTSKDLMVKLGAPSFSRKQGKVHDLPALPRGNSLLRSTMSPHHVEHRLFGGIAETARESVEMAARKRAVFADNGTSLTISDLEDNSSADSRSPARRSSSIHVNRYTRTQADMISALNTIVEVPHQAGYIERRDIQQKVTTQILDTIQVQEDVQRIATDLASEKVKVGVHVKEIRKLTEKLEMVERKSDELEQQLIEQLDISEQKINELNSDWEQKIDNLTNNWASEKAKAAMYEDKIAQQLKQIEKLEDIVEHEKKEGGNVQLELEVDEYEETVKGLRMS